MFFVGFIFHYNRNVLWFCYIYFNCNVFIFTCWRKIFGKSFDICFFCFCIQGSVSIYIKGNNFSITYEPTQIVVKHVPVLRVSNFRDIFPVSYHGKSSAEMLTLLGTSHVIFVNIKINVKPNCSFNVPFQRSLARHTRIASYHILANKLSQNTGSLASITYECHLSGLEGFIPDKNVTIKS